MIDALASGAVEPTRPAQLSSEGDARLRGLHFDWPLRSNGRHLHLAFEPRLVANQNGHACEVRFEYCLTRIRLYAPGFAPIVRS